MGQRDVGSEALAAGVVGAGVCGDGLRFAAPRRPRRAGQAFGLAVCGGGHAVHVRFAGVWAALAGDLREFVGPVAAGWWLFTVAVALVLVTFVHFLGGEEREAPVRDIYAVYGNPVWGVLALVVLYGLLLSLATLLVAALRAVSSRRARA